MGNCFVFSDYTNLHVSFLDGLYMLDATLPLLLGDLVKNVDGDLLDISEAVSHVSLGNSSFGHGPDQLNGVELKKSFFWICKIFLLRNLRTSQW